MTAPGSQQPDEVWRRPPECVTGCPQPCSEDCRPYCWDTPAQPVRDTEDN